MWFTKDASGFKGWFSVVDSTGILRTGLLAGDFTVTVTNQDDNASISPAVVESSVKPGLYNFVVSSSFMITNGIGDYGIVVEVNTLLGPSGPPSVVTAFSQVLDVSDKDFNDLAEEASVSNLQSDITDLLNATISAQFTIEAGSTSSLILTDSTVSDNVYDGMMGIVINSGTSPLIVSRTITNYNQTNGGFTISPNLPFTPTVGDQFVVIARSFGGAIASAVWTVASSPTTPGTFGELVNTISGQTTLIPGLI